jgi:ribonuclease HII
MKSFPTYAEEQHYPYPVAGVDEAGRGAYAGPVVSAAVILMPGNIPPGINDSKKLSQKKRILLYNLLYECATIGVGMASAEEIDTVNILEATKLAMQRAVAALPFAPSMVLVDGNMVPEFGIPAKWVIGGDGVSLSIAAASIIAKVTRDNLLKEYATTFPHYGWEQNVGYGTMAHQAALAQHGPCALHRKSFRPVAESMR